MNIRLDKSLISGVFKELDVPIVQNSLQTYIDNDNALTIIVTLKNKNLDKTTENVREKIRDKISVLYPNHNVKILFTQPNIQPPSPQHNIKLAISIASGKGGVGKSFVAFNLAYALRMLDYKVALLDADILGPTMSLLSQNTLNTDKNTDNKIIPQQLLGIDFMSIGMFVDYRTGLLFRGPIVHKVLHKLVYQVAWDSPDVMIVDTPPGTGDAHIFISENLPLKTSLLVTTMATEAILESHKCAFAYEKLNINTLGMIVNFSHLTCPQCKHQLQLFQHDKTHNLPTNLPILAEIPFSVRNSRSIPDASPVLSLDTRDHTSQIFLSLAKNLANKLLT